ncbi:MAG: hypothetical protein Q8M26_14630 [Pseudolabrys sp.]|nr:hypothetical protein [Pseudolabrys sp.]
MIDQFSFCRSMPLLPKGLKEILDAAYRSDAEPALDDEQDALYTRICGVAPGLVEAYATPAARDARLGPCAAHVEFVSAGYRELATAGLAAGDLAVGHRIGDVGFEAVVRAIVEKIACRFLQSTERTAEIVVDRVAYTIDRTGRVMSAIPLYGEGPSDTVFRATAAWLRREFGPRLAPDAEPDSTQEATNRQRDSD